MTLRKILIVPLVISLIMIAIYGPAIVRTANIIFASINVDLFFVTFIVLAILFQLIGHFIRSKKAASLFDPIESSKVSTQLRAFSVGQLFNNLLPFRIGEIIRAIVLSQKLNISLLYTMALIVFERALDLLVVVILSLAVLLFVSKTLSIAVVSLTAGLLAMGLISLGIILAARRPPRWLLVCIYAISKQFNSKLKNLIRFKFWSLSYGLSRSLSRDLVAKYLFLTIAMWVSYLVSTALIAVVVLRVTNTGHIVLAAIGPYIGIATPAGPAGLGVFSASSNTLVNAVVPADLTVFNIIAWFTILVPISLIGILSLFKTPEPIWKKRRMGKSRASLANKIIRNEDVSGELEHFLESYYRGNNLSSIVSRLEVDGEFSLARYFRGGSDAITILALKDKKYTVKKIIPIELKDRLRAQYDWLYKYGNGSIVKVSNEITAQDYYSIDIAYDKTSVPMFEYIHEIPLEHACNLLRAAWSTLNVQVYPQDRVSVIDKKALNEYINRHIFSCVEKAKEANTSIAKALWFDKLVLNGIEYDNLTQVIEKIKKHPQAWRDISKYQSTGVVHGDMIIDNLLFSRKKQEVIIIDPAPDGNIVNGPVFDFAKAAQSLYCGYEFLLRDESPVELRGNTISFNESKSLRFSELDQYMRGVLAKEYLSEGEVRAILFHAGALFIRRLKHQVHYTPENALKFYAVGVRTLNHFLSQYP